MRGSSAGLRRKIVSNPASTRGTGRNFCAGICGPSRMSHHGARLVDRSMDGGTAARLPGKKEPGRNDDMRRD